MPALPPLDIVQRLKLLPTFPARAIHFEAREICPLAIEEIERLRALVGTPAELVDAAIPGPPMRR